MPVRITTQSGESTAVTDIPDGYLVLDMDYNFVPPSSEQWLKLFNTPIPVDYTPFKLGGESVQAFINTYSGVYAIKVEQVPEEQYHELPLVAVPEQYCASCTNLKYVTVKSE